MALDPSAVLSKVGTGNSPTRLTLGPAQSEIVVDGGAGGATLTVTSGTVLSAAVDNSFQPGAWAPVSGSQGVSGRRAFRWGGPDSAPVSIAWS